MGLQLPHDRSAVVARRGVEAFGNSLAESVSFRFPSPRRYDSCEASSVQSAGGPPPRLVEEWDDVRGGCAQGETARRHVL